MSRIFEHPYEEVIRSRSSVRTFDHKPLSNEVREKIEQYIQGLTNPFSGEVSFKLLQSSNAANSKKLGTYGMIEGAIDYVGVTVQESELAYESVGYEFEKLILYAASIGIGTCWLGGTFSKGEFAKAMEIKEGEIFPAISPLGTASKRRASEALVRMTVKADLRKPWAELFFNKSFSSQLTEEERIQRPFGV